MSKTQEQIAAMKVKKNPGKPGNFWLGAAYSYRHENITGFATIARLCENFLKDYANAPYGVIYN